MTSMEVFEQAAKKSPSRSAPYNFATLNERVLVSPVADTLNLFRPIKGALEGTIEVEWKVETPLLIGGSGEESDKPFKVNDTYMIPGSSLRGMLRSVMEIAAFSRLEFYDDFVGATRNMNGETWKKAVRPRKNDTPFGGWLFKYREEGKTKFAFVKANVEQMSISNIVALTRGDIANWHDQNLHGRIELLREAGGLHLFQPASKFTDDPRDEGKEAMLVFAGKTPEEARRGITAKQHEHIFVWPAGKNEFEEVDANTVQNFLDSLHRDSNNRTASGQPPEANFDALKRSRATGFGCNDKPLDVQLSDPARFGVPVFTRKRHSGSQEVIYSLTAFTRVPYEKRLSDVARKTQPDQHGDRLDFTQALMGWAPPSGSDINLHERGGKHTAWRSRVMIGFAKAEEGTLRKPERLQAMKPKPSFFPFYLKPGNDEAVHPVDYDNPSARLRGRKRYPAGPGPDHKTTESGPRAAPRNSSPGEMESDLVFLEASPTNPLIFTSKIKVRNITKEELGALVWCVTLGQFDEEGGTDQGFRHMLGRAKAFGRGQVQGKINLEKTRLSNVTDPLDQMAAPAMAQAQSAFKDWVVRQLVSDSNYEDLRPIRDLLNIAYAPSGETLRAAGALDFPKVANPGPNRDPILEAYSQLKARADERSRERFEEGHAGQQVKTEPNDDAFIGLPEYPHWTAGKK